MTLKTFKTQDGIGVTDNSNLTITQSTVGWITIYGLLINEDNDSTFSCVAVDADGNSYFGGYDDSDNKAILVKFDSNGSVQWSNNFSLEGMSYPILNIYVNEDIGQLEVIASNMVWIINMNDGSLADTVEFLESNEQSVELSSRAQLGDVPVLAGLTVDPTLGNQALVTTSMWSRVFGSIDPGANDYVQNVGAVGDDLVVAVGSSYNTEGFSGDVATVTVFNADGSLAWARILNESDVDCGAVGVATTNNRILVTHYNNDTSNCYLTCLNLNGGAVWQKSTYTDGKQGSSVVTDEQGNVYWIAQSYWDEFNDDAYKIIKLDIDGNVIWSRWAGNRNDCRISVFQSLAVNADSIFIAGNTDDTANDYNTAFAMRLPADGNNIGYLGYYFWVEGDYDVDSETATLTTWNVIPTSITVTTEAVIGWTNDTYIKDNNIELIRNQVGGRLIFGDGTQQTSSATDIAQLKTGSGSRRLALGDRGKHIYCSNAVNIIVPYDYDVPMPIGSTVVIVNNSGGTIDIQVDGVSTSLIVPGLGSNSAYTLSDQGMATLLKVDTEIWFMSGVTLEIGGF